MSIGKAIADEVQAAMARRRAEPVLRKGEVTGTGSSPNTVTVNGRKMRYLASYSPTNGDTVAYTPGPDPIVLGELA